MDKISLKAYAKINLALDVIGKRENGYHDVRMIMQSVDLYDELTFSKGEPGTGIVIETNRSDIPVDGDNLISRAIKLMSEEYSVPEDVHVKLIKRIPVAAGMAGGSTDCAAAIKAMNSLYDLGLTEEELRAQGVKLGADVPYCIMGGAALSEGIGEVLTRIEPLGTCKILVVKPPFGVSTAEVYRGLRLDALSSHPQIDEMRKQLKQGNVAAVAELLENVLETVTVSLHPQIEELKDIMRKNGALNALMSGSGPTVFGIYEDEERAARAADKIRALGLADDIYVTEPVA